MYRRWLPYFGWLQYSILVFEIVSEPRLLHCGVFKSSYLVRVQIPYSTRVLLLPPIRTYVSHDGTFYFAYSYVRTVRSIGLVCTSSSGVLKIFLCHRWPVCSPRERKIRISSRLLAPGSGYFIPIGMTHRKRSR